MMRIATDWNVQGYSLRRRLAMAAKQISNVCFNLLHDFTINSHDLVTTFGRSNQMQQSPWIQDVVWAGFCSSFLSYFGPTDLLGSWLAPRAVWLERTLTLKKFESQRLFSQYSFYAVLLEESWQFYARCLPLHITTLLMSMDHEKFLLNHGELESLCGFISDESKFSSPTTLDQGSISTRGPENLWVTIRLNRWNGLWFLKLGFILHQARVAGENHYGAISRIKQAHWNSKVTQSRREQCASKAGQYMSWRVDSGWAITLSCQRRVGPFNHRYICRSLHVSTFSFAPACVDLLTTTSSCISNI